MPGETRTGIPGRRIAGALALLAVAVLAAALVLAGGSSPPAGPGGASTEATATVERRNLVATETQAGTLGYGDAVPVPNWHLLGPMTALNGVMLIGWSTALIFEILRRSGPSVQAS